ncbi:MAG: family 16 glycosylhydrolase, partial [Roseiflexaceae bacterium]
MITTTQPPSKRGRWWRLGSVASLALGALLVVAIVTPSFSRGVDQLQMLLPTAGAIFKPGDQLKIQWSYQDSPQPFPVTLYLARTDAGATDRFEIGDNLQPDPAATTTFDWFIPNNIPAGRYIVTVSNFNASVQQSTGAFSIAALPQSTQIRVLYPPRAAGPPLSAFEAGSTLGIRWDFPAAGPLPVDLYLDVFSNTTLRASLLLTADLPPDPAGGSPASGHYDWTVSVPHDQAPQNAQYKIRAVSAGGAMGSSADFFTIAGGDAAPAALASLAVAAATNETNLIRNGSFESATSPNNFPAWTFSVRPGAAATLTQDTGAHIDGAAAARVDVVQANPVDWYAQLSQAGLPASIGKSYLISFWARASASRSISVVLQRDSAPWTEYFYSEVSLTGEWQQYSFPYVSGVDDDHTALRLNLARSAGQIWVDDVAYVEITAAPAPSQAAAPQPNGQSGSWRLLFQDEFNGAALDSSKWVTCYLYHWADVGCYKTNGTSASWYMPDDVLVGDGTLKLRAQHRTVTGTDGQTYAYSSGLISSGKDTYDPSVSPRFAFLYGYVEMRARVPAGQGLWSAFWMLQANGQWPWEIDMLESLGHQPDTAFMTVHYPAANWDDEVDNGAYTGPDLSADFHTYAVEWAPDKIVWYIDGIERKRFSDSAHIPSAPMYVMANLAVGGDWPGPP